MSRKTVLTILVKYLALVVLYLVLFVVGSATFSIGLDRTPPPDQQSLVMPALLLVALVNTFVISVVIRRLGRSGWRLVLATMFAWYGTMTFMTQIESAWFGPALGITSNMLPALFLNSVPLVVIFTPVAALVWGKWQPQTVRDEDLRLPRTASEWSWKLAVIAAGYLVLYLGFGYVVAWQNPALRQMYGNGANQQVFDYARLIPFQILRSALWVLFALPMIRMTRGVLWQVALVVALLFALPPTIGLAIPNPIMPDPSVRFSHFVETSTSNFIYGVFVTWLLQWRPHQVTVKSSRPARL